MTATWCFWRMAFPNGANGESLRQMVPMADGLSKWR
jgi:hypothetical protein